MTSSQATGFLRGLLRRSPVLLRLARRVKRRVRVVRGAVSRRRLVTTYFASHDVHKLHLGAGPVSLDGWLNADLIPTRRQHVFMDVRRPFPFPSGSFDYVYSEHLISMLTFSECEAMLAEAKRVLRPGGRVRIADIDLACLVDLYHREGRTDVQERYIRWITDTFLPDVNTYSAAFVINNAIYNWGKRFQYDKETLPLVLKRAGFIDIVESAIGQSTDPELRGVERHGDVIGEEMNTYETIVFEAVRAS